MKFGKREKRCEKRRESLGDFVQETTCKYICQVGNLKNLVLIGGEQERRPV